MGRWGRWFRRRRRGPYPEAYEGIYERDDEVAHFLPDGPPRAWWVVAPVQVEGTADLRADRQGRVRARVELVGWLSEPGRYGRFGMYGNQLDVLHARAYELLRPRPLLSSVVNYTLEAESIEAAAETVSRALETPLHVHHSPMIGTWYADVGPADLVAAGSPVDRPSITVLLERNDPEPGVVPPHDPEGLPYVLSVFTVGGLEKLTWWSLSAAGIRFMPGAASRDDRVRRPGAGA